MDMHWLQAEIQQQAAMLQNVSGLADEVGFNALPCTRSFAWEHTYNGQVSDISPPDGRLHLLLKHWTAINPQIRSNPQMPQ